MIWSELSIWESCVNIQLSVCQFISASRNPFVMYNVVRFLEYLNSNYLFRQSIIKSPDDLNNIQICFSLFLAFVQRIQMRMIQEVWRRISWRLCRVMLLHYFLWGCCFLPLLLAPLTRKRFVAHILTYMFIIMTIICCLCISLRVFFGIWSHIPGWHQNA